MRVLPRGWARVPLAETVEPRAQRVAPEDFKGQTYIGLEHVEPHTNRLLSVGDASAMASSAVRFEAGDVLYGRMRPYLNKVLHARQTGVASAEFIVLPRAGVFDQQFLMWRLASRDFVDFACSQYEGDRPRVKWDQLARFEVEVPPLAEQARIVEQLETLFSELEAGAQELAAAQMKLTQYRRSLLKAAVEGDLTAEWRASNPPQETGAELLARIQRERRTRWEATARRGTAYSEPTPPDLAELPELPNRWVWASIDQLCDVVRGASPRPAGDPRYFGGAIPWITVGSLTADDSRFLEAVSLFVTEAGKAASRYIEPGTLLITNSGATLGVPKITLIGGCINDGSVALLNVEEPLKTHLYWYLTTQTQVLRATNQGAAQPNLNTGIVRRIAVPICGLAEMTVVNELVDAQVEGLRAQRVLIERTQSMAAAQRQNILRAAFSGQLVPQDPNDEPAGVLLERIRAERAQPLSSPAQSSRRLRKTTC